MAQSGSVCVSVFYSMGEVAISPPSPPPPLTSYFLSSFFLPYSSQVFPSICKLFDNGNVYKQSLTIGYLLHKKNLFHRDHFLLVGRINYYTNIRHKIVRNRGVQSLFYCINTLTVALQITGRTRKLLRIICINSRCEKLSRTIGSVC